MNRLRFSRERFHRSTKLLARFVLLSGFCFWLR
jgi:hypothetical protein